MEKTTADLVREEISRDIFLENSLSLGLINNSALARLMLPNIQKTNKKATIESIMVAIARYQRDNKSNKIRKSLIEQIKNSQIATKNDIIHATFFRNKEIANSINELSRKIRWDLDEIYICQSRQREITIIFDRKNKEAFRNFLSHAVEIRENCAILSIKEGNNKEIAASIEVSGLYAYFIGQISKQGINILDIISTRSQITLVVNEKELTRSYEAIKNCIIHHRKNR
jgi:aspartokinase